MSLQENTSYRDLDPYINKHITAELFSSRLNPLRTKIITVIVHLK